MSYKALYRTYRPSSFEEVVGQQHIVTTLKNAVKQNKIAHAYLFCGPRGTGKTSIAKLLAKAVNCEDQQNAPCNQCRSCLAIQQGNHPDIVEIDAASNNGVDEVRELIEKGMDRLMENRTVFVIAHRLSTVRNSKAIMVLDHGEIIERGSHDELIAQKGRYYQLYTGQFELD